MATMTSRDRILAAFSPDAKFATMKCIATFMHGQKDLLNDWISTSGFIARFVCLFKSHAKNEQIVKGIGFVFNEIPPTILSMTAKQIADEGGIAAMFSSIIHHHSSNSYIQKVLFAVIWKCSRETKNP